MPTPASLLRHARRLARWAAAALLAGGLAAGAAAQGLSLRYLTQSDGLSNLAVTTLVQMPDGRLWIGTENGLYRHDGARITRVDPDEASMPSRYVSALADDGRGGLWIGTKNGLFHLGEAGLSPVDTGGVRFTVRQGQTIAATADGGALVAAVAGLYAVQRDGTAWRARPAFDAPLLAKEPALATIHTVATDADGAWWLGCDQALCRWQAGALQRWGKAEGLAPQPWARLLRTRDGALWVRSQTQVLRRAAGAEGFEDVTPAELSHGVVRLHQPLVEDGDGRVLTSSDTGLLRWQAGRWESFGPARGLEVGGGLMALLVDRNQGVWLGMAGLGLAHWRGYQHWRHWTRREGLASDDVWGFAEEAPGRMWLGTGDGAAALQPRDGNARLVPQGGTHNQVGNVARDASGQMWMATYAGELFRRPAGGTWQRVAAGLPLVLVMRAAPGGGLWLAAEYGLYFVTPAAPGALPKLTTPPGLDAQQAKSMVVHAGCVSPGGQAWFGTSAGLLAYDPARGVMTTPKVRDLPADLTTANLDCSHDGVVWVASSDQRLWRVSGGAEGWHAEALQPGAVLGRRSVMALLADRRGWLWVSTDDGVLVWNGRQWRRFDESNGLVWSDCSWNALHEDAAGDIWIGSSRGASQVLAPERLFDPVQAQLRFTRVTRDGRPQAHDRPWTAPWSAGALQIAWAVPVFTNRSAQQVRYRLRGLSDQWSATPHDDVSFTALPAGRYTFEAQAENPDLGLVSEVASLQFEILPPWWLSAWALAAYGAAAVALVVLAHRWRVGLLMRRQRELEGLVGQRTAELQASYEQMRTLALTDGLTGAMNRRAIADLAARELARARRGETPVAFMLLDVDHFKRINDTHGHPAGDAVLAQLVQRLRTAMRDYDAIGRWGGEEFLLVLPGLSLAHEEGRRRAESLQRRVAEEPFDIGGGEMLAVSCSAGVVGAPAGTGEALEALIGRADAALYDAKHGGRDRTAFAA